MNNKEKIENLYQKYGNKKVINVANNQSINTVKEINVDNDGSIWFSLEDIHTGGRIPVSYEEFLKDYKVVN